LDSRTFGNIASGRKSAYTIDMPFQKTKDWTINGN